MPNDCTTTAEYSSLKGFTLVELSMVLVIVGLLIGGILAGKTMIETATINRLIKEVEQISIASQNFKLQFNYWPGDYPRQFGACPLSPGGIYCYGDGDGAVLDYADGSSSMWEIMASQYHLLNSGLLIGPKMHSAGLMDRRTALTSSYDQAAGIQVGSPDCSKGINGLGTYPTECTARTRVGVHVVGVFGTGWTKGYLDGTVAPSHAKAIDNKMDDGRPSYGKVLSGDTYSPPTNKHCLSGANYNVLYSERKHGCHMFFYLNDV